MAISDAARAALSTSGTGSAVRNATIDGSTGVDTLTGIAGESNVLSGLQGDDSLVGQDRPDFLFGGSGDDTLIGGGAGDFLQGDSGDDVFILGAGDDVIHGFAPAGSETTRSDDGSLDLIDATALTFAEDATAGLTVAYSGTGAGTIGHSGDLGDDARSWSVTFTGIEALIGTGLSDTVTGGAGAETIMAGGGNDEIATGAGGGSVSGDAGNDKITVGAGAGEYSGGLGEDTLSAEDIGSGVVMTLDAAGRGSFTAEGARSTFAGFEVIVGSAGADAIRGSAANDILAGAEGNDTISGGDGTDAAVFDLRAVEARFVATGDGGYRVVTDALGDDLVQDVERFVFSDTELSLADVALIAEPAPDDEGGDDDEPAPAEPIEEEDTGTAVDGQPPIGFGIETRSDRGIGDVLFGADGISPSGISYVGDADAIALLPEGYTITDGATSIFIESGIFLTNGGGPGTENTETGFSVDLGEPGDDRLSQTAVTAFPEAGGTNDAAIVTLTVDGSEVPSGTLALDLFFGSDEYPEFADSAFVDIAAVYVNGVNYALFANDPQQPLSIVGDAINTTGNFFDNTNNTFDTEYDGFSTLLTVLAPVNAGPNEIVIAIADTGDSILDSGLFIGDAEPSEIDATGSFANVIGTGTADLLTLNAAPQIVSMNGGADTVSGTSNGFGGDIIRGWSDNDTLEISGNFGADAILTTVTESGVEVGIDANGNGTPENVVTLIGDFRDAEFVATETAGGVTFGTVGTRPAAPVIEQGGSASERLTGNTGADSIKGGGGNDTIAGDEGADTLKGANGNDDILGSSGDDVILGEAGADALQGNDGDDVLLGGPGNDTADAGPGADTVYGEDGNDVINGGDGADLIGGGSGGDVISAGGGNDFIGGGADGDRIFGGAGQDTIGAGDGDDFAVGDGGNDVIAGGAGNDELDGEYGNDTVAGSYGDDLVYGGRGNDNLGGGTGRDTLIGGLGDDTMGAGAGSDVASGGEGDDFIAGGGRDDVLRGDDGNDTLNGGTGSDTLTGGAGADLFVWNARDPGDIDVVTDYVRGEDTLAILNAGPGAVRVADVIVGGQLYAAVAVGGQQILFEGFSQTEIDAGDFLLL